jgi:hypothetical protein
VALAVTIILFITKSLMIMIEGYIKYRVDQEIENAKSPEQKRLEEVCCCWIFWLFRVCF